MYTKNTAKYMIAISYTQYTINVDSPLWDNENVMKSLVSLYVLIVACNNCKTTLDLDLQHHPSIWNNLSLP